MSLKSQAMSVAMKAAWKLAKETGIPIKKALEITLELAWKLKGK